MGGLYGNIRSQIHGRLRQCFVKSKMRPMGFIHAECALNYFGTIDILDRVGKLSPGLDEPALAELAERLENPREPKPEADEPAPEDQGPDVAKARPQEEAEPKQAGNSG